MYMYLFGGGIHHDCLEVILKCSTFCTVTLKLCIQGQHIIPYDGSFDMFFYNIVVVNCSLPGTYHRTTF